MDPVLPRLQHADFGSLVAFRVDRLGGIVSILAFEDGYADRRGVAVCPVGVNGEVHHGSLFGSLLVLLRDARAVLRIPLMGKRKGSPAADDEQPSQHRDHDRDDPAWRDAPVIIIVIIMPVARIPSCSRYPRCRLLLADLVPPRRFLLLLSLLRRLEAVVLVAHVRHLRLTAKNIASPRPGLHHAEDGEDRDGKRFDENAGIQPLLAEKGAGSHKLLVEDREDRDKEREDGAGKAHRCEHLYVVDAHVAGLLEAEERKRDGREDGHDVELKGSSGGHDVGNDGCEHRGAEDEQRGDRAKQHDRNVCVVRVAELYLSLHLLRGGDSLGDVVDRVVEALADLRAVVDHVGEHDKEDHEDEDLLDGGEGRVRIDLLRDFHKLHQNCSRKDAVPNGNHKRLVHFVDHAPYGILAGAGGEERPEVAGEEVVRPDSREHRAARVEHRLDPRLQDGVLQPVGDVVDSERIGILRQGQGRA